MYIISRFIYFSKETLYSEPATMQFYRNNNANKTPKSGNDLKLNQIITTYFKNTSAYNLLP